MTPVWHKLNGVNAAASKGTMLVLSLRLQDERDAIDAPALIGGDLVALALKDVTKM